MAHKKGKGFTGFKHSEETKLKISKANIGRKLTKKHIEKIRKVNSLPKSKEHKENISKSKMGIKNVNWKGDEVGLSALHEWIKNHKPKPKFCEECGIKKPYDLANISGEYKRDINDFEWLCRRCHMISDGRLDKFNPNWRGD